MTIGANVAERQPAAVRRTSTSIPLPVINDINKENTNTWTETEMVNNRPTPDRVENENADKERARNVQSATATF